MTQFYPNWPLYRYLKKYDIRGSSDQEICNKSYQKEKEFQGGIFSVGCYCDLNITLGFEIMTKPESEHNLFCLLMCRDLDMFKLKGVIYDYSCGLDNYLLNREPREFQYLQCFVDGAHWNGHKKTKKNNQHGRGGHLGCSESYNFNIAKPHLPHGSHSQGREQIHSELLDKCVNSLTRASRDMVMIFLRLFLP